MDIQNLPIATLLVVIFILVLIFIEIGYRIGSAIQHKREVEKESSVSAISGYILGLLAFIIAFSFGIVTNRFESRKELVREEANIIRTAWKRADFLPDTDRIESRKLIKEYVELRLSATQSNDLKKINTAVEKSTRIQDQLWNIAVINARKDLNSDVAALYIESINNMDEISASRVAVALHTRIPKGIWYVLLLLTLLGMLSVGYQIAISGSKRSWSTIILAISFSLVIIMVETLDRPNTRLIPVSQFPIENLNKSLDVDQDIK